MFETILLPIDLNHPQSWEKALPMARQLAGEGGTLHILGIVPDFGMASVGDYLPPGFETRALQRMETDIEAFIAEHLAGARARPHVGHGHVPEAILAAADKLSADLIVMASHPPGELRSFFVGSATGNVVRHSTRAVLVVR